MAQLDRPKYSSEEEDVLCVPLQSEGESHEQIEHHGEKKSVLKKVKAKAKKIKDSIKGHVGHGHDHGEHSYDEDDDDDDEEMDTDPEVHGYHTTQTYITVQQGGAANQRGHSSMEGVTHAPPMSSTGASEPSNTEYIPGTLLPVSAPANPPPEYQTFDPRATSYVPGQGDTLSHSRTDTGMQTGSENTPVATAARNRNMDEFDRGMAGELKREAFDISHGGAHGTDARGIGTEQSSGIGSALDEGTMLEKDPHAPKRISEALMPERYQEKVADPSGMGSEEMGMISPVLHQVEKMKIHSSESDDSREIGQEETMFKPSADSDMAPSFVTGQEEESLLKSSSESDLVPSMGSHDQFSAETVTPSFVHQPETQTEFSDATRGSDLSSQQDQPSYTEKISAAASTVADKAKQATGAVTSKLGYGGTTEEQNTPQSDQGEGYGEKISNVASAIADKAVHAKDAVATTLAEVGSTVASKVPSVASKVQSSGTETEGVRPSEKGVSMKEYLAEKFKPGEEEKALSEVISEAIPLHKAKDESEVTKASVKVRVTESDEVKKRLGEFDEKSLENAGGSGSASPGRAVLDRIYDAATSWFGKGGETQPVSKGFKDNPDNPEGNVADRTP